jgi:hypothetical protein
MAVELTSLNPAGVDSNDSELANGYQPLLVNNMDGGI